MPTIEFKLSEDLKVLTFWRAVCAEFLGTLILLFVGTGSIILGTGAVQENSPDVVKVSLSFGLAIVLIVWTFGPVSGAHVNPAVSLAMVAIGKASLVRGILYIVAQCAGATVGSALVYGIAPANKRGLLGVTDLANGTDAAQGFACEAIITFVLVLTICAATDTERSGHASESSLAPLTIGLAITVTNLMAIPYSGASLNPARSLAPAIVINHWNNHWVYWIGPILGGTCGSLVYNFLFSGSLHPQELVRSASVTNMNFAQA